MKEKIGIALAVVGFFAINGIAATDDFMTLNGVQTAILPLIIKTIVAIAVFGFGVMLVEGGEHDDIM